VSDLYFDAEADAALTALERDATRARLSANVAEVLAALEQDPAQAWLRRRRFQIGLWCVVVAGDDEEWAVLWEQHPTRANAVVIQYIGAATFT
jgi:hypothetical protein